MLYSYYGEAVQQVKARGQSLYMNMTESKAFGEGKKKKLKNDNQGMILFVFLNHKTVLRF